MSMPFYRFTLTDPYHVEVCSLLRLWLKKTIREPDTAERHLQLCHVSQSTRSVTRWFGSPNPRWKKKKSIFVFLFLKALGYILLPSSFFPEQEFITPHGFLIGEVGEMSKKLTAGLPVSTTKLKAQRLCLASPALAVHLTFPENIL